MQSYNLELRRQAGYYTFVDVGQLLGIYHGTLRYWAQHGYIPAPSATINDGTRRYYTAEDVEKIREITKQGEE